MHKLDVKISQTPPAPLNVVRSSLMWMVCYFGQWKFLIMQIKSGDRKKNNFRSI